MKAHLARFRVYADGGIGKKTVRSDGIAEDSLGGLCSGQRWDSFEEAACTRRRASDARGGERGLSYDAPYVFIFGSRGRVVEEQTQFNFYPFRHAPIKYVYTPPSQVPQQRIRVRNFAIYPNLPVGLDPVNVTPNSDPALGPRLRVMTVHGQWSSAYEAWTHGGGDEGEGTMERGRVPYVYTSVTPGFESRELANANCLRV